MGDGPIRVSLSCPRLFHHSGNLERGRAKFLTHSGTFLLWWDSKPLCDEFGIPRRPLIVTNTSNGLPENWRAIYTDQARENVQAAWSKDIEEFGYEFA